MFDPRRIVERLGNHLSRCAVSLQFDHEDISLWPEGEEVHEPTKPRGNLPTNHHESIQTEDADVSL